MHGPSLYLPCCDSDESLMFSFLSVGLERSLRPDATLHDRSQNEWYAGHVPNPQKKKKKKAIKQDCMRCQNQTTRGCVVPHRTNIKNNAGTGSIRGFIMEGSARMAAVECPKLEMLLIKFIVAMAYPEVPLNCGRLQIYRFFFGFWKGCSNYQLSNDHSSGNLFGASCSFA